MKTEPTEALELKKSIQYGLGIIDAGSGILSELSSMVDDVVNIAFSEGQSSPKIKQLEWVYDKSDEIYIAKLSMFEYRIWQDNNQSFMKVMINNNHCTIMRCITIEEAKSAAQRDFEKRIKECLE